MSAKKGKHVNKTELAEIFGVSLTAVDNWIRRGIPYIQKGGTGRAWLFDSAAVSRWRDNQLVENVGGPGSPAEEDIVSHDEARRRKALAEAEIAELTLAERRNLVIAVDIVTAAISDDYSRIRTRLLGLPAKLAPRVDASKGPAEIQAALDTEIRAVLAELTYDDAGDTNQ